MTLFNLYIYKPTPIVSLCIQEKPISNHVASPLLLGQIVLDPHLCWWNYLESPWWNHLKINQPQMEVSWNRGTPSHHAFSCSLINEPAIGLAQRLWKPPNRSEPSAAGPDTWDLLLFHQHLGQLVQQEHVVLCVGVFGMALFVGEKTPWGMHQPKCCGVQQRKFVHGILAVKNGTKTINDVDSTANHMWL